MSDFKPNKIGYNSKACMQSLLRVADAMMTESEDTLIRLYKYEIDRNGNGSHVMKESAKSVVRSIVHDVFEEKIHIEAGIDEKMARSMATEYYIRTMVVIHGNMAQGGIHSKPGMSTWKKHVRSFGPSTAQSKYDITQFNQWDVSDHIQENVMKQIEHWFRVMLIRLLEYCRTTNFFSQFITVG